MTAPKSNRENRVSPTVSRRRRTRDKHGSASASLPSTSAESSAKPQASDTTPSASATKATETAPLNGSGRSKGNGKDSGNVRVVGRIRPLARYELEKGCRQVVGKLPQADSEGPEVLQIQGPDKRWFELDAVFDESSTQQDVYVRSGAQQAVCEDIFRGFNCTILAYGQTGAGKTFTMGTAAAKNGNEATPDINENDGVIPRACHDLYRTIQDKCDQNATVELSYMEVYNEEIRDLLSDNAASANTLRIRENLNGEVYVRGLQSQTVACPADIGRVMDEASGRRVVASTKMNATSSRSHAICVLRIKGVLEDSTKFQAKLTLVDLAGSERIKKTGAGGARAQEGININKGLFVLGQVVSALSEQRPKLKRKPPYRDSKLTRLLQDSLGGNSRTIMVACVSPADFNLEETVNTLRYATSARNIKNTATRNVVKTVSPEEAAKLQRENDLLKQQVKELQGTVRDMEAQLFAAAPEVSSDEESIGLEEINEANEQAAKDAERIRELEKEVKSLKRDLRRANGDIRNSLHDSAIELPAMKVQMAMLEDELHASQSINSEVDDLQLELEQAKAEAKAAKAAAQRLSKIIEKNEDSNDRMSFTNESSSDFQSRVSIDLSNKHFANQHEMEIQWVNFVFMVLNSFQENMRQLGDYFDMVSKIVDSPDIIKMLPSQRHQTLLQQRNSDAGPIRKRWWGGNNAAAANELAEGLREEIELRQKLLTEHISFYQERFLEVEDRITGRSEVVDSILESLKQGERRELGILPELTAILIDSV